MINNVIYNQETIVCLIKKMNVNGWILSIMTD